MKPLATCRGRGSGTPHQSRQQRPLTRYFPEVVTALQEQLIGGVVLDGELVVCSDGPTRLCGTPSSPARRWEALGRRAAGVPCRLRRLRRQHRRSTRAPVRRSGGSLVSDLLAARRAAAGADADDHREAGAQTWLTDPRPGRDRGRGRQAPRPRLSAGAADLAEGAHQGYRRGGRRRGDRPSRRTGGTHPGHGWMTGAGYGSPAVPTACLFLCGPSSAPCWSHGGGSTPGRRRSVQAVRTVTRPSRWNTTRSTRPWWSSWTPMLRSSLAAGITRPRYGASGRTWPTPQRPTTLITRSIHALMNDRG